VAAYRGTCSECGALLVAKLETGGTIPPPTIALGCQEHNPVVLVDCDYEQEPE